MGMPMEILQAEKLTKRFDEVTAVDGVSFGINSGEIFGFLGPNGAGKTTGIDVMSTRQIHSNFFRFPMLFLCGLFIPVENLPVFIRPISYALPLTYGADILKEAIDGSGHLPLWINFPVICVFAAGLFLFSLRNIKRKWVL